MSDTFSESSDTELNETEKDNLSGDEESEVYAEDGKINYDEEEDDDIDEGEDEEDEEGIKENEISDLEEDDEEDEDDYNEDVSKTTNEKKKGGAKKDEKKIEMIDKNCIYNSIAQISSEEKKTKKIFPPKNGEPDQRITKKILYEYERVKVLSDRIKQLDHGAKPLIKNVKGLSSTEIAELELETDIVYSENGEKKINKAIPIDIHRELPNGDIEIFKLIELKYYR